jgi:hypothetical protein
MIVVIPSCRSIDIENLRPLIDFGARFIVIDDSDGSIRISHPQFEVYNWSDYGRLLGQNESAIPKRNGACRALGFYLAWKEGDPDEPIIALDDDCVIEQPQFPHQIIDRLGTAKRRMAVGKGVHMNTFDILRGLDSTRLFPRGFPYSHRIAYKPWKFDANVSGEVHFNLGLWRGALDINAIDRLQMESNYFPDVELFHDSVVIPSGTLVSLCAGNMHFRRELIPAIYQLPMNVEIMPKGSINRYGDIWAGFILKRMMDIRGHRLSVGGPIVKHHREGPYLKNVSSEHLAGLVNEEFIDLILRSTESIRPGDYLDMMLHFRNNLLQHAGQSSQILRAYLKHLTGALSAWLQALDKCR